MTIDVKTLLADGELFYRNGANIDGLAQSAIEANAVDVRWNGSAWGARGDTAEFGVRFLSTNDAAATAPDDADLQVGDLWYRHPDAV